MKASTDHISPQLFRISTTAALRKQLAEEYAETEASPYEAAKASMVEEIIDPANTRSALISALEMLACKRVSRLPKKHSL